MTIFPIHVQAKQEVFEKWPEGTLVCEDENLSLRGPGQHFGACMFHLISPQLGYQQSGKSSTWLLLLWTGDTENAEALLSKAWTYWS